MNWKTCGCFSNRSAMSGCQHLGKSDLGQRRLRPFAREAEALFSRRACSCDHGAGTNTLEQKARFWHFSEVAGLTDDVRCRGVKRTHGRHRGSDAIDPTRTLHHRDFL
jgi:hypothetical protein